MKFSEPKRCRGMNTNHKPSAEKSETKETKYFVEFFKEGEIIRSEADSYSKTLETYEAWAASVASFDPETGVAETVVRILPFRGGEVDYRSIRTTEQDCLFA